MKPAICTQCGGIIEVDETKEAGICSACGTAFVTEKVISNYITNNNTVNNITNINYGEKNDGEAEFARALTRIKLDDFEAADAEIGKAIKKAPENPKFWIYSAYIDSERFTRLPTFAQIGELKKREDLVRCIKEVGSFFALADEAARESLTAELSVNLKSEITFFSDYIRKIADHFDIINLSQSIYNVAKAVLEFSEDDEERDNATDAVTRLILKTSVADSYKYNSDKQNNEHLYSLCEKLVSRVNENQRLEIDERLNKVVDGHRLVINYADFYKGYKDGVIKCDDKSIDHISLSLYGSGRTAALYMTPNIKTLYTPPDTLFYKIEYAPECAPDSVSRFFENSHAHIIPAEWETFALRQNHKGYLPTEYVLYFKGSTKIKAAVAANNFSDKRHIISPLVIQNGKFGCFRHNVYKQYNTREYAESLVKKYFPQEYGEGKLVFEEQKKKGCYVATAVYGSYDCPQVWTLRRYRDDRLAKTLLGRAFIRLYYAVSPTFVKLFGKTKWFNRLFKSYLDKTVKKLNDRGFENTAYNDKEW